LSGKFPDPIGVGSSASLALAVFGEVVCTFLVALGLFTRFAATVLAITMATAFFAVHKGALSGPASGELAFIYLAGWITLLISGAGAFRSTQNTFERGTRSAERGIQKSHSDSDRTWSAERGRNRQRKSSEGYIHERRCADYRIRVFFLRLGAAASAIETEHL
jgi:hypothetical protein